MTDGLGDGLKGPFYVSEVDVTVCIDGLIIVLPRANVNLVGLWAQKVFISDVFVEEIREAYVDSRGIF